MYSIKLNYIIAFYNLTETRYFIFYFYNYAED